MKNENTFSLNNNQIGPNGNSTNINNLNNPPFQSIINSKNDLGSFIKLNSEIPKNFVRENNKNSLNVETNNINITNNSIKKNLNLGKIKNNLFF